MTILTGGGPPRKGARAETGVHPAGCPGGTPAAVGSAGSSAGRDPDRGAHDLHAPHHHRPGPGVDALVAATPASRDRVVDLLRAASICVVVAWHWSLSVTHWHDGRLTMPNPVGDVPGLWAATWVLQVMPVFFFVGGYANLAGWQAVTRDGGGGPVRPWPGWPGWPRRWSVARLLAGGGGALRASGGRSVLAWGWWCSCRCGSWPCTPG